MMACEPGSVWLLSVAMLCNESWEEKSCKYEIVKEILYINDDVRYE